MNDIINYIIIFIQWYTSTFDGTKFVYIEVLNGFYKVVIFDAFDQEYQSISNEDFDKFFLAMEGIEVVQQTSPQFNGGTRTLNGHRRIVVANEDGSDRPIDVGTHVIINNKRFNLMYDGLKKMCFLCREKHGRDCPLKARFEKGYNDETKDILGLDP